MWGNVRVKNRLSLKTRPCRVVCVSIILIIFSTQRSWCHTTNMWWDPGWHAVDPPKSCETACASAHTWKVILFDVEWFGWLWCKWLFVVQYCGDLQHIPREGMNRLWNFGQYKPLKEETRACYFFFFFFLLSIFSTITQLSDYITLANSYSFVGLKYEGFLVAQTTDTWWHTAHRVTLFKWGG